MANTIKSFSRTLLTDTTTVLYTVPASTTSVITSIVIANQTSSDDVFTLSLNDIDIFTNVSVSANSTSVIDIKQALNAGETIKGGSGSLNSLNIHISGVEIT